MTKYICPYFLKSSSFKGYSEKLNLSADLKNWCISCVFWEKCSKLLTNMNKTLAFSSSNSVLKNLNIENTKCKQENSKLNWKSNGKLIGKFKGKNVKF